jgi:hypothetical protein
MQFTLLNERFIPIKKIETFQACVWVDRYIGYGEFEMIISWSIEYATIFKVDRYLTNSDSQHTMVIEEILLHYSADEGRAIKISDRSLESILERRVNYGFTPIFFISPQ